MLDWDLTAGRSWRIGTRSAVLHRKESDQRRVFPRRSAIVGMSDRRFVVVIETFPETNITRTRSVLLLPNQFTGFICDSVRVVDSIAPRAFLANVEFHFCRKNYGRRRKQIRRKRRGGILRR